MPFDALTMALLSMAALMSLSLAWRHGLRNGWRGLLRGRRGRDALDTVAAWHPEPARVLDAGELAALELARCAAPDALLLSQVPLSRFLRVSSNHSYQRWLARVGHTSADILVCDARSRVLAVIDVRPPVMLERLKRRQERMQRVLRGAGIRVLVWQSDQLPSVGIARAQLSAVGVPVDNLGTVHVAHVVRPVPSINSRELAAMLAEGDAAMEHRAVCAEAVHGEFHDTYPVPRKAS
jgi:Protein of unknown function (DUF2726)